MEQVLSSVQQIFEYVIQWAILLCEVIGVAVIVVTAIKGVIACFKKDTHVSPVLVGEHQSVLNLSDYITTAILQVLMTAIEQWYSLVIIVIQRGGEDIAILGGIVDIDS